MRYVLTALLIILCLIVVGVALGFVSLDLSAPGGPRLSASGVLAYWDCYYEDCEVDDGGPVIIYEEVPFDPYDRDAIYYGGPLDPEVVTYDPWYNPWYDPWCAADWRLCAVDGWREVDPYYYPEPTYYRDPWYVQAFPGFGTMAERIIPGSQWWSSPRPAPAPRPAPPPRPPQLPPSPVYPQPSCWISAQPTTVAYGASSVLHWESYNASHASLSDIGQVPTSGSRSTPPLASEHIFSLSVSGQGGSGSCYTRVTVQSPSSAAPSCIISAHPSQITRGQSSSLAWGSNNASSALLSGVGAVGTNGGMYVAPLQSTTYALTVYGSQNRSNTCTTQIGVLP